MDYTLAQYFTAFDQLAFDGAKEKLIGDLGYPELVHTFDYDPEYFSRGLVIDLQRGEVNPWHGALLFTVLLSEYLDIRNTFVVDIPPKIARIFIQELCVGGSHPP